MYKKGVGCRQRVRKSILNGLPDFFSTESRPIKVKASVFKCWPVTEAYSLGANHPFDGWS